MTVSNVSPTMVICGNSDDLEHRYRGRIEKVKFGVPIQEAFAHDIPATLLVLLLKVNKDGPAKKDIWRAPGNQAQVRKLSHIMQHGRLVNIANFSVYTAASVIKKFLTKLPGGIFGLENEKTLFNLSNMTDTEQQRQVFCRVVSGLGIPSQHLLVLLFGTFHMISESAEEFGTKMSADALGISVAPSLFHTCIHDGQRAKMEDVMRFKMASAVISKIIANFGYANLFPRESYEFYARITGRTLRVDENDWRFKFLPPARSISDLNLIAALGASTKINLSFDGFKSRQMGSNVIVSSKCKQISTSVGEMQLLSETSAANHSYLLNVPCGDSMENARSLSHLDNVHMRQTRRMKTRSQWFFEPFSSPKFGGDSSSAELKFQTLPRSLTRRRDRLAVKEDNLKKFSSAEISESETASCEIQSYPLPCTSSLMMVERKSSSRSQSIGESSSKCNILEKRCVAVHCEEKHSSSGAIVRRRSWRTHYVRPNKSFDEESYRKIQVRRSSLLKLHHNSSSNLSMPMCSPSRSFSSSMRKRFAELNPNISDVLIAHSSSIKNIPEPSLSQLSFV